MTGSLGRGLAAGGRVLSGNRHIAGAVVVLVAAVLIFPGTPAPSLLTAEGYRGPTAPVAPGDDLHSPEPLAPLSAPDADPPIEALTLLPDPVIPRPVPPRPELPGPQECFTDEIIDAADSVRADLSDVLGMPVPGAALRIFAAVAAGCSDDPQADVTRAIIDLAFELTALSPDHGIDPIPLPQVGPLLREVQDALPEDLFPLLAEALSPLADPIQQGCENVPLVVLVLTLTPLITGVPVSGSDLAQFIEPVAQLCSIFDQELADDDDDGNQ